MRDGEWGDPEYMPACSYDRRMLNRRERPTHRRVSGKAQGISLSAHPCVGLSDATDASDPACGGQDRKLQPRAPRIPAHQVPQRHDFLYISSPL